MTRNKKFLLGELTGHHFDAVGSLITSRKITQISVKGKVLKEGLLLSKKWMFDQKLFEEEPSQAWAKEHWIEWNKNGK